MSHKVKTIFDWLNEITYHKSPSDSFSEEDWGKFNTFLINRYLSMEEPYIELVDYVQSIPYENKLQMYHIYKEFIPKKKKFLKYTAPKKKPKSQELLNMVSTHFECSLSEASDYIDVLDKEGSILLLTNMGFDEKEIKKILKR